ncbi:MAG: class I SAM-dependent methyltransferase [Candidatus Binataceae bacterium]
MEWRNADAQPHHLYLWPHIRAFLEGVAPGRVADLGSGSGWTAAQIAAMGHDVIGIDISASGVAVAQNAFPKVRFRRGSVYEDLGEQFDIVVSSEVIEHLYEPRRFVANIYRSLRPGGFVILTTPYHGYLKNLAISIFNGWDFHFSVGQEGGHIKFFSSGSLAALLSEAGFREVQFRYAGRVRALARSMVVRAYR